MSQRRSATGLATLALLLAMAVPVSVAADDAVLAASSDAEPSGRWSAVFDRALDLIPFVSRDDDAAEEPTVDRVADLVFGDVSALSPNARNNSVLNLPAELSSRGDLAQFGTPQGLDLNASYVWESPRYGQFIVSTRATYYYPGRHADASEGLALSSADSATFASIPELQRSLTLTWQIGKHSATAVTHYNDSLEDGGSRLSSEQLDELVGFMPVTDLQYGYQLKTDGNSNAEIAVGVRNVFDRRSLSPLRTPASRVAEPEGRAAYGTIKYQF